MRKKILKKIISIVLIATLLICMIPVINVSADTTDGTNVNTNTETNFNSWINSDIRKFMNIGAAGNIANSTTDENQSVNRRGYASHFTKEEYDIIKPSTVNNGDNNNGDPTTDRFVLPSGNFTADKMNVLSWGQEDISIKENVENKDYLIPLSYWSGGVSDRAWIRSASEDSNKAYIAERCNTIYKASVQYEQYVAPFFRIDISDVHFASMVSASDLLKEQPSTNNITKKLTIGKSSNLGKINSTDSTLPSYGMYLKTKLESFFKIENINTPSDSQLQVNYKNGDIGKAIVVQMYESDDIDGTPSIYTVVFKIEEVNGSVSIDISDWNDVANKSNYTLKVWMEDLSTGASLAKATTPQTFACSVGSEWNEVVDGTELHKNTRAFAMKNELKCSWGDLSKSSSSVIAGGCNEGDHEEQGNKDYFCKGRNVGVFATNQKIYYGIDDKGIPIEFWIAGRETGKLNDSGSYKYTIAEDDEKKNNSSNIMCLYQTSAIDNDKRAFKDSTDSNKYQSKLGIEGIENNYTCADIGKNKTLTVSQNSNNVIKSCEFISSNPYVATVNATGEVELNNPGTFEIIAIKRVDNGTYSETVRTEPITMSHNLATSYSEDTKYGTHYVKCNVEGCGATFLAHEPDYKIENNTHKCNGGDTGSNNDSGDCNLNHTIDYKYVDDNYHRCAGCSIQENHNYGNGENGNNDDVWEVVEMSTPTKKGKKKKVCIGCGHEVIEDIPCIGQNGLGDMLLDDENNDFNASIANEDEVKENIVLSQEECNKILEGKTIKIILKVLNHTAKVDSPEKEAIEKALNGYKIGTFLDIDLLKILDGVETEIEETKGLISIKFLVPDELINKDNGVVRTYKMFRYHDGKVEMLDTTYDSKTNMITFKTDRFSTYALTYSDKDITNSGESAGKGEASKTDKDGEGSGDSSTEKDSGEKSDIKDKIDDNGNAIKKHDKTPDTGDRHNTLLFIRLMIISGVGIAYLISKKRKKI